MSELHEITHNYENDLQTLRDRLEMFQTEKQRIFDALGLPEEKYKADVNNLASFLSAQREELVEILECNSRLSDDLERLKQKSFPNTVILSIYNFI